MIWKLQVQTSFSSVLRLKGAERVVPAGLNLKLRVKSDNPQALSLGRISIAHIVHLLRLFQRLSAPNYLHQERIPPPQLTTQHFKIHLLSGAEHN